MALLRSLFWFVVFLVWTFVFTVVFEHGFTNFPENAKKEYAMLEKLVGRKIERKPDPSDKVPVP